MTRQHSVANSLRIKLLCAAVSSCFASGGILANPTLPTVTHGNVDISGLGSNSVLIKNLAGGNAIINWNGFSIGATELTRFQQFANLAVLNRVTGPEFSSILGQLQSDGRVFLINPNGIVFGAGAQIDVAGLVASSLNLSDTDFLNGTMKFTPVPGAGTVANYGNIVTPAGGQVYLVGPAVTNGGLISSPQGEVVLAAGNSVELVNPGTPGLSVSITAAGNEALNMGQILADSGRVGIFAGLINQTGMVSAGAAVLGVDGSIKLVATDSTNFAAGSQTISTGPLTIQTGDVTVAGNVQSGPQTIDATGAVVVRNEPGGFAQLQATGGQSINARSVEVTALGGGSATIFNSLAGDQSITIAGGGTSPGLDLRTLSGGGFASIWNDAGGAAQRVMVTDADHVTLNGSGGGSAFISAPGGTQTVSITGGGSNALNLGSAGAAGLSILSAGSQDVTAGANGESGSISIVGSGANGAFSGLISFPSAGNHQTVSTSGMLSIAGSTGLTQPAGTGVFQSGTGQQSVNAAGIVIQGGSVGSGNGGFINSSGSQQVNAGAGGITLIGGAGGTNNTAGIFQTGVNPALTQSIAVTDGGSLSLRGGGGGTGNTAVIGASGGMQLVDVGAGGISLIGGSSTGLNNFALINQSSSNPASAQTVHSGGDVLLDSGDAGERNFALIQAFGGLQSIDAGRTTLRSGAGGAANFAVIQARKQEIGIHGDLTIVAGGSVASGPSSGGAGIGGRGGAAPTATNLSLAVSGDLTLTGGSVTGAGALIGASPLSNDPTDISIAVGGNAVLNPGTVPGAFSRIGTRSESPAGGNIEISALGSIALNSTSPDMYSFIRTADGVTLRAREIAQGADSRIQANSLTVETAQGASLAGNNNVNLFNATNTWFGDVGFNNTSPLLTVIGVSAPSSNLALSQSGDLLVTGLVTSGPQAISATGALTVRGDAASSGQLSAFGGQMISAQAIDVVAQDGGSAFLMNSGSGDQTVLVSGGGTGAGLDVRTLSGGGVASILNNAFGATQTISVTDADHISVSGMGTGGASLFAIPGNQVISITGSGANAINIGSAGAQGFSNLGASHQTMTAGAPGESGSITIVGSAGNQRLAGLVSQPGAGNSQSVSTSGALSIVGGTAPAQLTNFPAGIFHNGTGQQTISAQSIVLQGGNTGVNNSAQIGANNGTQLVNAGSITLVGGSGGTGNSAQLRTNQGQQTIVADQVSLTAGAGGTNNFAIITAPGQSIAVSGDLTITGGGSLGTPGVGGGARVGGRGGAAATPTNLMLTVGGDVTLNGGTLAGAAIGSSVDGGQPTTITMNVGGDVTLNPGTVTDAGTRIGSPAANVAGGEIVVNAGGAIALNSAGPGNAGAIRTTDGVTLRAREITQGPDALIQANSLTLETQQGVSLTGANAVNTLSASNWFGDWTFGNTSPLLTVTGVSAPSSNLTLNQSGDLLVTGLVMSGPQSISATGALTVRGDAASSGQLSAFGGQTISAHAIDVVAQDGGSAFISNNGVGDQVITVAGGGSSAGFDVRTLSGGGTANISNNAFGATQSILVTDADHINVNGMGNGSAIIVAVPGNQVISITGSGANAISFGSAGAQGASQAVASNQNVTAGLPGESGSISIVGSAGNQRLAGLVSGQGVGNSQSVSTAGVLGVTGGTAPAQLTNFPAGIFHNGTGQQTISAQSILLQGGSIGTNNSAQIGANNGTQFVNAGSITLVGGSGGTGNSAQLRANQGQQTIFADQVSLTAGAGGTANFAVITAPTQSIAVNGDLTITGGGSLSTPGVGGGARIGGRGGALATPTNLMLGVGGDVTLNGGTVAGSGSAIGSSVDGGQPTQITMNVGGDVTLNPGAIADSGSRLGSPAANVAGGEIVVNAGGAIALNSAGPGNAGAIRTTDGVTLRAREITQGPDALIQANSLTLETQLGASLAGANAVNSLGAVNTTSGDFAFNNASPLLTVTGIDQVPAGALSLNQAGNLLIGGDVSSGAQTIGATGDFTITPGDGSGVSVVAYGPQSFTAGGNFSLLGGSAWNGYAQTIANGPVLVSTGGDLTLQGGSGLLAYGLLYGKDDIRLTVGDELHLNGGSGLLAFARVQTDFWDRIYLSFPNRESGGYFVDGREGVTHWGLDGFFTGLRPAILGRSLILNYGD